MSLFMVETVLEVAAPIVSHFVGPMVERVTRGILGDCSGDCVPESELQE